MIAKVESPAMFIRSSGSIWTATRNAIPASRGSGAAALKHRAEMWEPVFGRSVRGAEVDDRRHPVLEQDHPAFVANPHLPLGRSVRTGASRVEGEHPGEIAMLRGAHPNPGMLYDHCLALRVEIDRAAFPQLLEALARLVAHLGRGRRHRGRLVGRTLASARGE